jgi:hypothetical protein
MKIDFRRIFLGAFAIASIALLIFIMNALNENESSDFCAEKGAGITPIHVKVFDYKTRKLIDSVQLQVRYGISADCIVDTLLFQGDGISYANLNTSDCEWYWLDVSNKYYYCYDIDDVIFEDTVRQGRIEKGKENHFVIYLKPATTIKLTLERELKNKLADTVFLYGLEEQVDGEPWGSFDAYDFSNELISDFPGMWQRTDENGIRRISKFFNIESGADRKIRWIRKEQEYMDTVFTEFKCLPFDTVRLNYVFKKDSNP